MRGASEVTGDVCRHQVLQLLHPLEQSGVLRLETTHRLLPTVNLLRCRITPVLVVKCIAIVGGSAQWRQQCLESMVLFE